MYLIRSIVANQFLIVGNGSIFLIDTGIKGNSKNIFSSIHFLGYKETDLAKIIITHADGDHYGSLNDLKTISGATANASRIEKIAMEKGETSRKLKVNGFQKIIFSLLSPLFKTEPTIIDENLSPGERLPILGGLEVLDTKGHTPGHISLYSKKCNILFSGDSININGDLLEPFSDANCWDEEKSRISFNLQLKLNPKYICGGHGFWKKK